ncbi:uncharacterized protein LOC125224761 isoform X2 [Leguminivora glycinivorella]|uniref:uncharacterized protein LOC125224761 isoform X2 n=1 Tax=Leguminivora glycinivorella TaxID=1035111 RepID=UPI0020109A60|nr:uncharacterized protein LOC125224761 isoform X2 [Leguminivora glycinivorella]XP_047984170.1 uncharacterized protein LOC125224761 isoform X2 [Leguminivora glycinivorella]
MNVPLATESILDFLQFLGDWEKLEKKIPVSRSTITGLNVTLRATLEILDMLNATCNYKYLMTANLSQDPLERFFSVMRYSCGGNDHPDPKLFGQVYRLASCFSLVKPPKGCNVSGTDLLKSILNAKDLVNNDSNQDKQMWLESLDNLLDNTEPLVDGSSTEKDHDYNVSVTSDAVQSYIAGYIVRKLRKILKCTNCVKLLQMRPSEGKLLVRSDVINKMDLYGGLIFPSDELFNLTKIIEQSVLRAISKTLTNMETISQITVELQKETFVKVGCVEHCKILTKKIIDMYVVMRAHFLAKYENKRYDAAKTKTKMNRKNAKLLS